MLPLSPSLADRSWQGGQAQSRPLANCTLRGLRGPVLVRGRHFAQLFSRMTGIIQRKQLRDKRFPFASHRPWKRNRKVALKPRLRRRRGAHRDMEWVVSVAHRLPRLQRGESTDEPTGFCASTSPQPHATPASARTSEWPHVAHSAISPRRASCTPRCSG
jgi:hypothetical protein